MTPDLPFDLYRQAKDRAEEFEAEQRAKPPAIVAEDDRQAPTPGEELYEAERLRKSAEIAEHAFRLAVAERDGTGAGDGES